MLNHLVFNENMTSWLLFFFTWQIEKCDFLICILITPPLISFPCTFLVIWIWRVNTLWLSLLALLLKMAKKNHISLHFSDSPAICRRLNKTLFLPAEEPGKGFPWEVRELGSATTTAPWHPAFSISLQISHKRSYFMLYFMLQALPLSNRLIVLLEWWLLKKKKKKRQQNTSATKSGEDISSPRKRYFCQNDPTQFMTGHCLLSRASCL